MAINLYINGTRFVSISSLAKSGVIKDPKETFKRITDKNKIKIVPEEVYNTFLLFAKITNGDVSKFIISENDTRIKNFRTNEPIGFISSKLIKFKAS